MNFRTARSEAPLHQFVGGKHFAAEIVRQKQDGDDNAPQQISEDQLQEGEVAGKRESRRSDDGKGAGLGRDNGESDSPPRCATAAQEVILKGFLAFLESARRTR